MEEDKYFEKIEAYLRGELPADEAEAFQAEIKASPELKAQLLRHRLADRAVELAQDEYLREKMQSIREAYGPLPKPEARVVGLRLWLANAAAILILVVAGIGGYAYLNYSGKALIRSYYEQAASPTIAGGEAETEQWFSQGLYLYYQQKDYVAALQSFSAVEPASDRYQAARYFVAHCELRTGQYAEALEKFNEMMESDNVPPFAERGEVALNQALCYLGLKQDEEASRILDEILTNDRYSTELKERARELNRKIDSFWRGVTF